MNKCFLFKSLTGRRAQKHSPRCACSTLLYRPCVVEQRTKTRDRPTRRSTFLNSRCFIIT